MENFQNSLMKVGMIASNNKYLKTIKNSFQKLLPVTMAGAIAVLWICVIVNNKTGIGAFFKPIMVLEFLNPAFSAINTATLGCLGLWITFMVGSELGKENQLNETTTGIIAIVSLITVTMTSQTIGETSVSGIFSKSMGSEGLFTGMIVAILSVELYSKLANIESLKIKLPPQVPAAVAKPFEQMIPSVITFVVISVSGLLIRLATGYYVNDLIFNTIQTPLMKIGGSLPGILTFCVVSCLFWSVGLHGDNMIGGILGPITTALTVANLEAVNAGLTPTNIVNYPFQRLFFATGGTGMVLALTLAFLIKGKRPENTSVCKMALPANLFNIGEVNMFGLPVVLNPTLIIPFILAPVVSVIFGYFMTAIGICPIMYIDTPWTMPPFLYGFIASGGKLMGGVVQLIAVVISTVIYLPFVSIYEKQQAAQEKAENE